MKKKVLAVLLTVAMTAAMLVGCGDTTTNGDNGSNGGNAGTTNEGNSGSTDNSGTTTAEEGKVLNVYCWNDEFQRRVTDHYPGYEKVDEVSGKIGDVTVNWLITANADNAYQNNLDAHLLEQANAAADDKIDIFLIEADYALKYIDSEYAMPVADLGITDADIANQYKYTQDIVTDSNGVLKGLSWQGCPGVLFYSREAAKEVFGTDEPADIQQYVKDWATFNATAATVAEKGYKMVSSVNDTYRTYSNNVTSPWVVDGKINIDTNIMNWVNDSKALYDAGYTGTHDLWSNDWNAGFYPEGKVFSYFGPAWLINFCMADGEEGSIATNGGWAATEGPQGFFWGGTWICAAAGTDNATLVKDIMLKMTCDETIMTEIVVADDDFVNNKPAMDALADGSKLVKDADGNEVPYSSRILGGQNPLAMYCAGVASLDLSNLSAYDQGCNESFQQAMKDYFEGNATLDEALELFYKNVETKYPELTH